MISEIAQNLYRITLPMPFRLRHVHAYALVIDREVALFDTGMIMPGAFERLTTDLASIGLSVACISDIYLTHTHTDHCGMAGQIRDATDAAIHMSRAAGEMLSHFTRGDHLIAQARLFYSKHGLASPEIDAIVEEIDDMRARVPDLSPDSLLASGQTRQFGARSFEVIETPGHAAGHVCFFFRDEGLLLAGDHILPYIAPSLSPTLYDDLFEPLPRYLESLDIMEKLPIQSVHPGHGNAFENVEERIHEIRAHHAQRKAALLATMDARPKTTLDICVLSAGPAIARWDDWEKFMALNETHVYLQALARDGAISQTLSCGKAWHSLAQ